MGLPINVADLLNGSVVESARLECKEGWNPEAAMRTLTAFANDFQNWGGGYLVFGIREQNGKPELPPVGLEPNQIDAIQKELLNIGHRIIPAYFPVVEPAIINGKHILVAWAPGGQNRPYKAPQSFKNDEKSYAYYVRINSSTVKAKDGVERELLQLTATVPFDDRVNHRAETKDLQLRLIQAHLQAIGSDLFTESSRLGFPELCERMRIVDGPIENLRPRNVGLLFFNEHPEQWIDTAWIDVVELPSGSAGSQLIEKRFSGPLDHQLRGCLEYLKQRYIKAFTLKHALRAEASRYFTYPFDAVEEALSNAVYHRGYDTREPIEVRITPDAITILSYPGPDPSVSIDLLSSGNLVARRYRNRRIGEFLKELRLTEGRGTGVPKMLQAMESNGSPPPEFSTDEGRFYFSVKLTIHPDAARIANSFSVSTRGEFTQLSKRQLDLLAFTASPRTRSEIMSFVGVKHADTLRRRYIQPLMEAGLLAFTRPDLPRAKNQKYVTTQSGMELLSNSSADLSN